MPTRHSNHDNVGITPHKERIMIEMTMIESGDGKITWECSGCKAEIKDKKNFEDKVKTCPKCGEEVSEFYSLFEEE